MAHFAKINDSGIVIFVTVGRDEDNGKELELSERTGDTYKQTSYNTRGGIHYDPNTKEASEDQSKAFRKNYAGLGYTYDSARDAFISPKPYPSWTLDEETCHYNPPSWPANDTEQWIWDEATVSWVLPNE